MKEVDEEETRRMTRDGEIVFGKEVRSGKKYFGKSLGNGLDGIEDRDERGRMLERVDGRI